MTRTTTLLAVAAAAWTALAPGSAGAVTKAPCATPRATLPDGQVPRVQLALLLDTSNSMDGLIDQARSQLWSVVNEFAAARRAGQAVELQVALYEYGNNRIPARRGYVRQVLPFTTDLDRVSEELFALTTFGGEEYCGLVIQTALDGLRWSASPGDLKAVFIAGNEPFSQGPVDFRKVIARARARGVAVNTIHCGSRAEGERTGWSEGARLADGTFGVLDQDRPVAHVPSPQDDEIARLGGKLNDTYIPYGAQGAVGQARQQAQDSNAAKANKGAAVNRAFTKATRLYSNEGWDLVDAVNSRQVELTAMKTADLPPALQGMTFDERRAVVEAKAREYIARLRSEAERLGHLVENVLFYARVESGRAGAARETVDLQALVDEVRPRLVERAGRASLDVVFEPRTSEPVPVRVDRSAVEQILLNLVDNACKYAARSAPPHIEVVLKTSDGRALLRVSDHGPGISGSERRRLFQPFSKSDRDAANSAPGIGLGLALSRRLARAQDGDLSLDASGAGGAVFVLSLPLAHNG